MNETVLHKQEIVFKKDTATLQVILKRCEDTIQVWGTNYFSLFVSYRFTSNKTQLKEFPESKSDMPLFLWVLALK